MTVLSEEKPRSRKKGVLRRSQRTTNFWRKRKNLRSGRCALATDGSVETNVIVTVT